MINFFFNLTIFANSNKVINNESIQQAGIGLMVYYRNNDTYGITTMNYFCIWGGEDLHLGQVASLS